MYITYLLAKTLQDDYLREANRDRLARKLQAERKRAASQGKKKS